MEAEADRGWRKARRGGELGFRWCGARDEGGCARFLEENNAGVLALVIYRDESVRSTPRRRSTRGLNGGMFGTDLGGRKTMTDRRAILVSEAERKEADCCELGLGC